MTEEDLEFALLVLPLWTPKVGESVWVAANVIKQSRPRISGGVRWLLGVVVENVSNWNGQLVVVTVENGITYSRFLDSLAIFPANEHD